METVRTVTLGFRIFFLAFGIRGLTAECNPDSDLLKLLRDAIHVCTVRYIKSGLVKQGLHTSVECRCLCRGVVSRQMRDRALVKIMREGIGPWLNAIFTSKCHIFIATRKKKGWSVYDWHTYVL